MPLIPSLIFAVVDAFVSRRDIRQIAKEHQVTVEELQVAFNRARAHSWQAKFAQALNEPGHRRDLLAIKNQLACFEQQFGDLMSQFQRARQTCDYLRDRQSIDIKLIMKADALAFRIHQAAARVLRDIQKTEIRYEKAEKNSPELANSEGASKPSASRSQKEPVQNEPMRKSPELSAVTTNPSPAAQPAATESIPQIDAGAASHPTPDTSATELSPSPTEEEFLRCFVANRQRIKNTPAKDRPALMQKLIEQARVKQSRPTAA